MKSAILAFTAVSLAATVWAQPKVPAPQPLEKELIDMEASWAKAMVTRDMKALNEIIAPDWQGQSQYGQEDRAAFFKSFEEDRISSMVPHDLHVRFVGTDVAIVQGMDTEVAMHGAKSTSGTYSWTDIFQKREGKWVAIASQGAPVPPQK